MSCLTPSRLYRDMNTYNTHTVINPIINEERERVMEAEAILEKQAIIRTEIDIP